MPALINMRNAQDLDPVYIDISRVTAIHTDPARDETHFFSKEGRLGSYQTSSFRIDMDAVLRAAGAAGFDFFVAAETTETQARKSYILPEAITYLDVRKADAEGNINVLIGVKGCGANVMMQPSELAQLRNTLDKSGRTFLTFDADIVKTSYNESDVLYIDPQYVTAISESSGKQMIVSVEGSGGLMMEPAEVDAEKLANTKATDPDYLQKMFQVAGEKHRAEKDSLVQFVAAITAKNSSLINLEGGDRVLCFNPSVLQRVRPQFQVDEGLECPLVVTVGSADKNQRDMHVSFPTPEARNAALEKIGFAKSYPASTSSIPKPKQGL